MQPSDWSLLATKQRCKVVAAVAAKVCERSDEFVSACASDQRIDPVETIASELIPWCDALRWIGKKGAKVLASRKAGLFGRPLWMIGVKSVVQRVAVGDVLILGTWNYPLLLPGVQIAQSIAAGNRVKFKPAVGTEEASRIMAECFWAAGISHDQLILLDSDTNAAIQAIRDGVDLIVLTGAAETGKRVLESAASTLSASIMELSGCDGVVVLPDADMDRLTDALDFGLRFNGSATCIAPRRVFADSDTLSQIHQRLDDRLSQLKPIVVHRAARQTVADQIETALSAGAVDLLNHYDPTLLREQGKLKPVLLGNVHHHFEIAKADLFAPVLSLIAVDHPEQAIQHINDCPYRLAASVFGPRALAERIANQLNVGSVTINDLIAPTADPRLPFGGRGQSGFGVTRGSEGLLAMTAPKVVSVRRGKVAPHLMARRDSDAEMLQGTMLLQHAAGLRNRLSGLRRILRSTKKR